MKQYLKQLSAVLFMSIVSHTAWAQEEMTLHFMNNVYQSDKTNPAFKPDNTFSFQVFNMYYNYYNSGFNLHDLTNALNQSSPADFLTGKMKTTNYLGNTYSSDLFSFRYRWKPSLDVTFGVSQTVSLRASYGKDIAALALFGNGDPYFLNNATSSSLSGNTVEMMSYSSVWAGFSHTLNDKFTYGLKYKLLMGQADMQLLHPEGNIQTDPNTYATSGSANLLINTSNVAKLNGLSNPASYNPFSQFGLTSNIGHAVDLGASYKVTDKLTLNASLINLGFINWKNDVNNYNTNGTTAYSSLPFSNVDKSLYNLQLANLVDTVKRTLKLSQTQSSYISKLSPQMYLSGMYQLDAKDKVGVVATGEYFNNTAARAYYAVGYTKTFGENLDLALTYSIQNNDYLNIGTGVVYRFPYVEAYAVTDNVLGFAAPKASNNYSLRFGLNFAFGRKKKLKDTDGDGVPDIYDACPTVAGIAALKGCPDADGDSIPDYLDRCPNVFGLAKFNGCPDTDGDGIPDIDDSCATVKGLAQFHGCPDTDGDGIPDKLDNCPTIAGVAENHGCPVEPKSEPAKPAAKVTRIIATLAFEFDKTVLTKASRKDLDKTVIELTTDDKESVVKIQGYADKIGSKKINLKLSKARAETVKRYLVQHGVNASRISTEGMGYNNPIAPNNTPKGRAKNRRAEVETTK